MNVNEFNGVGHATRDPEVKTVKDSKVAVFRLAVNRSFKKGDKFEEKAMFIDCEAWNRQAEYVEKRIKKGTQVYVRARLELDEWEKNGEPRSKHKLYVLNIQTDPIKGESDSDEGGIELPF